jgi:hypothetical protein
MKNARPIAVLHLDLLICLSRLERKAGPLVTQSDERTLGKEISRSANFERLLAEKVQEVDFSKGALQRVLGSTPEQRKRWPDGILHQFQERCPMPSKVECRTDVRPGFSEPGPASTGRFRSKNRTIEEMGCDRPFGGSS